MGRRTRLPPLGDVRKQLAKWRLGSLLWFPFPQDCCQKEMMEPSRQAEGNRHGDEPRAVALSTCFCRLPTLSPRIPTLDMSSSLEHQLSDLACELLPRRTLLWPHSLGPIMDLTKGDSDLEFEWSHSDTGHTAVSLRARIPTLTVKPAAP